MPPVKLFWYDGLKEQPKIKGVPEGEYLGDLPRVGGGGRGQGRGAGAAGAAGAPAAGRGPATDQASGFVGNVFHWNDAYLPGSRASARDARWQPVHRRQGHDHYRDVWRTDAPDAGGEDARLQVPAPLLTRSPGHYRDWIRACKGGDPACSNFNVSAPFVEWMLLGVIALRVEGKLEYDAGEDAVHEQCGGQ